MAEHYVPMEAIRFSKKSSRSRQSHRPPSAEETFADPDSIVSSDEDNNAEDSPSCSGASGASASGQSVHSAGSGASGGGGDDDYPYEMYLPETRKVVLHPGPDGLGMSVAGGVRNSLGQLPVFITDIDPGGAVDRTNVLRVGDRIINVNGEDVSGKSHRDVVLAIKAAGANLVLEVTSGPENIMKYVSFE